MSALSLASLGLHDALGDRPLSMASLGVFTGEAIITPPSTPAVLAAGGYTHEMDEEDVMDICAIIIMSGVLDGNP